MEKGRTFADENLTLTILSPNRLMFKVFRNIILLSVVGLLAACGNASQEGSELTARNCYDQALELLDADSVRAGEQLLHKAIKMAEETEDLHTLYLAQLRLAESLAWGNSEKALAMAKQALATYERNPDSERNHIIILDYIGTYASQLAFNTEGSFDEALAYVQRAYELAEASRDSLGTEQMCQTLTSLANIYWATDDFAEALRYARRAEACATESLLPGVQQVLARCLLSCDSLTKAEEVYRQMEAGEDLQLSYIIQSNLAKIALRRNDKEAAEAAIDEAFSHGEDLYYNALQQKDEYYQSLLQAERDNERLRYSSALHRRTLLGGILLLALVSVAAVVVIRSEKRKRRQERQLRELEAARHELETAHHEQELQQREQELRMRDFMVRFLQNFILERSEVIQKLGESAKGHIVLSQHEWAEVERTLNAIDGDIIARLRETYPEIKEEDLQLCILTRLHLTNRAIGNIYGVSISAVQHRKLKLKKELFGEDNPEVTLEQVIENFEH